jgi:hypothetical protein
MRIFCKHAVQQNQIWFITLEQAIEFARIAFDFFFRGFVGLGVLAEVAGDAGLLFAPHHVQSIPARAARGNHGSEHFMMTTLNGTK